MGLLRDVFGPSKDEIWSQLSQEIGARFQAGGLLGTGKVTLSHGQWEITLDTYAVSTGKSSTTFTRLRAPYVNADGFRFNVFIQGVFDSLRKVFGLQDVSIGDPSFDDRFIVQSSSEDEIKRLLSNQSIRGLIEAETDVHFQLKDDEGCFRSSFPAGVDELCFETHGFVKDIQRLKELFELFALVLDELCKMGSAYQNAPGVTLS